MRFTWRITSLILLLAIMVVPLTAYASGGKCPDDPVASQDCNPDTPPYYVVINRDFEDLDRKGSGCQPFILEHPECEDCCTENGWTEDCQAAIDDALQNVTALVADRTDWDSWPEDFVILYVMCCACNANADGQWKFSIYHVFEDGDYEPDLENQCILALPPGTGIDLPAPLIVGGLAVLGAALVATGVVVRRRSPKLA